METLIGGGAPNGAAAGDLIKDTDTRNFAMDVIEASKEVPVLIDFWAPWCGPCKQLGPMLEKLVREAGGKVKLVKLNVDENQQLAQQFRIQSIPAVYAFYQGQPLDGFVGALPESQLKQFIDKLIEAAGQGGGEADGVAEFMEMARQALDQGDAEQAAQLFARLVQHDPQNGAAQAGFARALAALGDYEKAAEILEQLPPDIATSADAVAARSAIELAEQALGADELGNLEDRIAKDPDDHEARFDLANALHAGGHTAAAIEQLIELMKRDRAWNEDAARKQLLKLFEALGPTHELTLRGRRKLSTVLFS